MNKAKINKEALEQITGWIRRLWPEAEVRGWVVEELLQNVFRREASANGYLDSVCAAIPVMEERLMEIKQVIDDDDNLCHVWRIAWEIGRRADNEPIIGQEVLVYHVATGVLAWFAADTGNGIPVWYYGELPAGRQFHIHDIVAAWLAVSAEGWACCVEEE